MTMPYENSKHSHFYELSATLEAARVALIQMLGSPA
jgi:hypothetical protein